MADTTTPMFVPGGDGMFGAGGGGLIGGLILGSLLRNNGNLFGGGGDGGAAVATQQGVQNVVQQYSIVINTVMMSCSQLVTDFSTY